MRPQTDNAIWLTDIGVHGSCTVPAAAIPRVLPSQDVAGTTKDDVVCEDNCLPFASRPATWAVYLPGANGSVTGISAWPKPLFRAEIDPVATDELLIRTLTA